MLVNVLSVLFTENYFPLRHCNLLRAWNIEEEVPGFCDHGLHPGYMVGVMVGDIQGDGRCNIVDQLFDQFLVGAAVFVPEFMRVFPEGSAYVYNVRVFCADLGIDKYLIHPGIGAGGNLVVQVPGDYEVVGAAFFGPEGWVAFESLRREAEHHEDIGAEGDIFRDLLKVFLCYQVGKF